MGGGRGPLPPVSYAYACGIVIDIYLRRANIIVFSVHLSVSVYVGFGRISQKLQAAFYELILGDGHGRRKNRLDLGDDPDSFDFHDS